MPQRHVLHADERVCAHDAREPADSLRDLGIALVRHRRGALHAFGERLLDLPHLRTRQVADLRREPLERRRRQRERGEQLGVAVSCDHLRRDRIRFEPEPLTRNALDLGVELRVRADRPGELADTVRLECVQQTRARPVELERPAGELPAEGRRLGVDAV